MGARRERACGAAVPRARAPRRAVERPMSSLAPRRTGSATAPTPSRVMAATLATAMLIACVVAWLADPAAADNAVATAPGAPAYSSGLAALANDADVPLEWMPPGSRESP